MSLAISWFAAGRLLAQEDYGRGDRCVTCHFGIEDMHPWEPLSCTECHGGDGQAETKERAHVRPRRPLPHDERVLPLDFDPEYLRFRNPSNLRVIDRTCATCHEGLCRDFFRSLHATTAGHLSDGMYEAGVTRRKGSRFAMFPVEADPELEPAPGAVERLEALPSFDPRRPRGEFATHYLDLPPKACVRCHVWAPGVAVRGRLGLDGDYRSEGCAACHVPYADDGLSRSGDPTVDRFEPGHPLRHEMTARISTDTCTRCHYGDASIGLNFRGLAQLHPGQPAGPEVPGTTDTRLNRTFYQNDPAVTPPDVHHERGMHCIDCHTIRDVMGDGQLYGQMEAAVEIECESCHGTFERPTDGKTSRGRPIENLVSEDGVWYLISKVTGERHRVKQAAHVVHPRHPDYNERAAAAMTPEHARLECYACHGAWSPNFFGFHFDRNEQFTQLDMMRGKRTPGRVTTQEKVFSTFRGLYLGWNNEGRIAPYMVGFASMGTVHDEKGALVLDQEMPVTAAGLSGMTLIHHQLHTVRPKARGCADCHRNPTALGLGSPNRNFALARGFVFVGSSRGVEGLLYDRKTPSESQPVAAVPILGVRHVALEADPLQGRARRLFVSTARGVVLVDVSHPAFPKEIGRIDCDGARASVIAAGRLYVAAGERGVRLFRLERGGRAREEGSVPVPDARALALHWPHLYVADAEVGLFVVDVARPRPQIVGKVVLSRLDQAAGARDVALWISPSRPDRGDGNRSPTRVLAAVACGERGLRVIDVTEPGEPFEIRSYASVGGRRRGSVRVQGVAAYAKVDLGSPDGAIPTRENDYLAVTVAPAAQRGNGRLVLVRVTEPDRPEVVADARVGLLADGVEILNVYNPPFLETHAVVAGGSQVDVVNLSRSEAPEVAATFGGWRGAACVVGEAMPLDRLVDENGRALKDISHEGSRYFSIKEIEKILRANVPRGFDPLGPITPGAPPQRAPAGRGRR